jgi:hypothetical protein
MSNLFRQRLCFGCTHRVESPHNVSKSACTHPEVLSEVAHMVADENGSRVAVTTARTMNVAFYAKFLDESLDWPNLYDPLVIDSCDAFTAKERETTR